MEEYEESAMNYFENSFLEALAPQDKSVSCQLLSPPKPLIVVIDEASFLIKHTLPDDNGVDLSLFRLLRRALSSIINLNILFIMIDTNSRISDFSPPMVLNSSRIYRSTDEGEISYSNLLPPFFSLTTADLLVNCKDLGCDKLVPLFLLGRPVWAATWNILLADLVQFACRKLSCGLEYELLSSNRVARLVPFILRANLPILSTDALGIELVALIWLP